MSVCVSIHECIFISKSRCCLSRESEGKREACSALEVEGKR
jgi:hypothetical protein